MQILIDGNKIKLFRDFRDEWTSEINNEYAAQVFELTATEALELSRRLGSDATALLAEDSS